MASITPSKRQPRLRTRPVLRGRSREYTTLTRFLDTATAGLLQLHGPAGIGKSAILRDLDCAREDTIFVDASGCKTLDSILAKILDASGSSLESLSSASPPRQALLVDDIDALDEPSELLELFDTGPLRVILSSRKLSRPDIMNARLGPVTTAQATRIVEDLLGESPGPKDRRDITALVSMLDGVPLSLQLIASQLQRESPARLLALAKDDLLTDKLDPKLWGFGWAALEPRHHNVLAACTLFRGGFDEQALRALVEDQQLDATIAELVARALLERREDASLRMLWSVRGLTLRHTQPPEEAHVRHARHFLERAERRSLRDRAPFFYEPNLRQALEFGLVQDADIAARSAHQLFILRRARGPYNELESMLRSALARRRPKTGDMLTIGLLGDLGELCWIKQAPWESIEPLEHALALDPPSGTPTHIRLCQNMAIALSHTVELDRALEVARHAVASCPDADRALSISARGVLGSLLYICGENAEAVTLFEELRREDPNNPATPNNLGLAYSALGQRARARRHLQDYLEYNREAGQARRELIALNNIIALDLSEDNLDSADHHIACINELYERSGHELELEPLFPLTKGLYMLATDQPEQAFTSFSQTLTPFNIGARIRALALLCVAAALTARGDELEQNLARLEEIEVSLPTNKGLALALALAKTAANVSAAITTPETARVQAARDAVATFCDRPMNELYETAANAMSRRLARLHTTPPTLAVSADARWAWREQLGYVDFRRAKISRDLLLALLDHHDTHPGEPCEISTLFDAAWPGELWSLSARAKLHTAIHRLRDRLLGELLITHGGIGYSLCDAGRFERELTPPSM